MKKQSNTPHIRFQNYEDEWDVEKLKNIFGTIRNAFVGTATPYYVEKGNFYLESNNVKNGKINYNSQIFINDEFYEKQKDKWLKTNDIVMVQSGHVGHTAVIPEELNNTAAHALIVFTDYKEEVEPHFLNYQFQSNSKRKELDLIYTGNTIKHILASEMKNFKMDFPTFEEQSAIGSLFLTLDDLLVSYKNNLTNYQSLKATMLSKMFPKAGQTVPEIRLDGFEGEWELIKLGDFCDLITKGTTGKSQSEQGKVNFVKVENLKDNEIYPIVKISEEEHFGSLKRSILYKGDILFSIAGTLGRTAIVKNNILPANTNQALAIIRGYKLDAYFLLVVLSGEVVKDYIRKNPTVGAQPNLSLEQVSSLKIKIPSIEEQQAIGAYFSNLDNLIAAHQEKISQLETLKKKLLQDMFL